MNRIELVPTLLDTVCQITGLGFAAIARVTVDRWVACSVLDHISFGLKTGGEIPMNSTICRDIRNSDNPVVIDHVDVEPVWCEHPTPKLYGFQSYISVPIILPDGSFFGTLCAIDPRPAQLRNREIQGLFAICAAFLAMSIAAQKMD